jgi:hypothetical protein
MTRKGRHSALLLSAVLAMAAGPLFASGGPAYSLSVLVEGVAVPEYAARNRVYVEALKGKEFVLRITNPTGRRVAVALSVDGRNVIDAKRTGSREAAKWVLGPWETLDVPGWQVSGGTARRFYFTETSKSYAQWLGDTANVGTIEAVFYRERESRPEPQPWTRLKEAPAAEGQAGARDSAEAPSPSETLAEKAAPGSPPSAGAKAKPRRSEADDYAATGIGDATENPVQWVAFEAESSPAARIALRYEFRAQLVRLGVLPRPSWNKEDELFARDRARGFEHEYAPDPYRR